MSMRIIESPVGRLRLVAEDGAILGVHFDRDGSGGSGRSGGGRDDSESERVLDLAEAEIAEYFDGKRRAFTMPLAPKGTPFQRDVWEALRAIPFGETRSYLDIAEGLGKPAATRAVGRANGQNPIAIVVPCHRVIGSDGTLTGYGGGLDNKRWLLDHEARALGTRLL